MHVSGGSRAGSRTGFRMGFRGYRGLSARSCCVPCLSPEHDRSFAWPCCRWRSLPITMATAILQLDGQCKSCSYIAVLGLRLVGGCLRATLVCKVAAGPQTGNRTAFSLAAGAECMPHPWGSPFNTTLSFSRRVGACNLSLSTSIYCTKSKQMPAHLVRRRLALGCLAKRLLGRRLLL